MVSKNCGGLAKITRQIFRERIRGSCQGIFQRNAQQRARLRRCEGYLLIRAAQEEITVTSRACDSHQKPPSPRSDRHRLSAFELLGLLARPSRLSHKNPRLSPCPWRDTAPLFRVPRQARSKHKGLRNKFSFLLTGLGISCFQRNPSIFSKKTKEQQLYGFLCEVWGAGESRSGILPSLRSGRVRNRHGLLWSGCGSGAGGSQHWHDKQRGGYAVLSGGMDHWPDLPAD